jgi:hypothetical protein
MYRTILVDKYGDEVCELEEKNGFYVIPESEEIYFADGDSFTVETVWTED